MADQDPFGSAVPLKKAQDDSSSFGDAEPLQNPANTVSIGGQNVDLKTGAGAQGAATSLAHADTDAIHPVSRSHGLLVSGPKEVGADPDVIVNSAGSQYGLMGNLRHKPRVEPQSQADEDARDAVRNAATFAIPGIGAESAIGRIGLQTLGGVTGSVAEDAMDLKAPDVKKAAIEGGVLGTIGAIGEGANAVLPKIASGLGTHLAGREAEQGAINVAQRDAAESLQSLKSVPDVGGQPIVSDAEFTKLKDASPDKINEFIGNKLKGSDLNKWIQAPAKSAADLGDQVVGSLESLEEQSKGTIFQGIPEANQQTATKALQNKVLAPLMDMSKQDIPQYLLKNFDSDAAQSLTGAGQKAAVMQIQNTMLTAALKNASEAGSTEAAFKSLSKDLAGANERGVLSGQLQQAKDFADTVTRAYDAAANIKDIPKGFLDQALSGIPKQYRGTAKWALGALNVIPGLGLATKAVDAVAVANWALRQPWMLKALINTTQLMEMMSRSSVPTSAVGSITNRLQQP